MTVLSAPLLLGALRTVLTASSGADVPELRSSSTPYVVATYGEVVVRSHPWAPGTRIATIARGTRLAVRGEVDGRDATGCRAKNWVAVWPFGFVCAGHVRATDTPPQPGLALPLAPEQRLPFRYVLVRGDDTPYFEGLEEVKEGTPGGLFHKGMSLAVQRSVTIDEERYIETLDGRYVARDQVGWMGQGSEWSGVVLRGDPAPGALFAWAYGKKVRAHADHSAKSSVLATLPSRERVTLVEPWPAEGRTTWWRVARAGAPLGPPLWVQAKLLNEVHVQAPPEGVLPEADLESRWIDVDLGEQVVVAYRGDTPEFASLVSSGRGHPTPRGNYPIWAKVASMDMGNQAYEDNPYLVQQVPWVLLFQGHNALHAAYWHDRFGRSKSHGCVNLAPRDARWMFEWALPALPLGWTGYLPADGAPNVIVHVRDSSRPPAKQFIQERPPGPPDREEERKKLEEAELRRSLILTQADEEAAAANPTAPTDPAAPPAVGGAPRIEAPPAPTLIRQKLDETPPPRGDKPEVQPQPAPGSSGARRG